MDDGRPAGVLIPQGFPRVVVPPATTNDVVARICFALIWLGFSIYAFVLAPASGPDTMPLVLQLSTGQWSGINPWVIALFNLMGVWPLIYCCLLFADGRGQSIPAWPFASLSFLVGAFGLLPYLALRHPQPRFDGELDRTLRLFDSRWMGVALVALAIGLLAYGTLRGDWAGFIQLWRTDRFIHVMSLDFSLLCLLFPSLLAADMARRHLHNPLLYWAVALTPLFGPLLYLCVRPPLQGAEPSQA
jgi:hypothetical protein